MTSKDSKIFIGGLSWATDDASLLSYFSTFGEVEEAFVSYDRVTGRPRGFGFVVYKDPDVAQKVIGANHTVDGRKVEAKPALSRSEAPPERRKRLDDAEYTRRVFVGGLPPSASEDDFKKWAGHFGEVDDVIILYDPVSNKSRGFGFVSFKNEDSVNNLLSKSSVHNFNGKSIEVKRALPRDVNSTQPWPIPPLASTANMMVPGTLPSTLPGVAIPGATLAGATLPHTMAVAGLQPYQTLPLGMVPPGAVTINPQLLVGPSGALPSPVAATAALAQAHMHAAQLHAAQLATAAVTTQEAWQAQASTAALTAAMATMAAAGVPAVSMQAAMAGMTGALGQPPGHAPAGMSGLANHPSGVPGAPVAPEAISQSLEAALAGAKAASTASMQAALMGAGHSPVTLGAVSDTSQVLAAQVQAAQAAMGATAGVTGVSPAMIAAQPAAGQGAGVGGVHGMQGEEGGMPGMLGTMPATGGGISVPSGVSAYVAATGATQGTSGPVTLPHTGTTPAPGIGWQPGSVQPNSVAAASAVANAAAASAVANAAADPTPQNVAVAAATASAAVAAAEAAADVAGATAAAFPSSANVELAQTAAATAATAKIIDAAVSAMSGAQTAGGQLPALAEALTTMTDTSQPAMNIADTMANLHLDPSSHASRTSETSSWPPT